MMTVMTMMVCIRFMFYKFAINDESFPDYSVGKESACNSGDIEAPGLIPGLGRSPWKRAWKPTPVLLPGESHGQRSLLGYSPCDQRVRTD